MKQNMPLPNLFSHQHWRLASLVILTLLAGCQTAAYQAGLLPAEFRTASVNAKPIMNLAQVASPGASVAMLAPGDLLEITVATGRSEEKVKPTLARVADDGTVSVPVIGPVPVAGLEAFDASQNITSLAIQRGMYRHPLVTVEIKSKAVNRITVLGAVKEQGVHEIPRGGSDLISALAAAGGLTDDADSVVEIIRQPKFGLAATDTSNPSPLASADDGKIQLAAYQNIGHPSTSQPNTPQTPGWLAPQTVRIDLANENPITSVDYRLLDRDIVRVVPRKKEVVYVAGLVKKPGQFEIPLDQDLHLLDAIALAGGRSSPVADKVFVIRHLNHRPEPIVIRASLSKAKQNGLENLRLMAGDTISIEQTPKTAIVDTIGKFFRLSFGVARTTAF